MGGRTEAESLASPKHTLLYHGRQLVSEYRSDSATGSLETHSGSGQTRRAESARAFGGFRAPAAKEMEPGAALWNRWQSGGVQTSAKGVGTGLPSKIEDI